MDRHQSDPSPVSGYANSRYRAPSLGQSFDPRSNSFNLIRLVLALLVIFSHSIILGGFGSETIWGHTSLGAIAVDGFFALSGFLIAASACRNSFSRFLWQRFLRIFPAFWACLVFTAVIAGPIHWLARQKPFGSYWTANDGPFDYVLANSLLRISAYGIAGTPTGVPVPGVWNGSLWTLFYEFMCYLMVAVLAIVGFLRRRRALLVLWAICWSAQIVIGVSGTHAFHSIHYVIRFVPIYLAGVMLWIYRDKIPDSPWLFFGATALFVTGVHFEDPHVLSGPPLAYMGVWVAMHFPGKQIGTKYDISYGVYIYAYVVGQILATWNIHQWGYWPFCFLTICMTCVLAAISCVLIEQPALRLRKWTPRLLQTDRHS
jgi:peptidoglycan/LPS O-acetylase OafA/YrhL